jgi:hypothetical protein
MLEGVLHHCTDMTINLCRTSLLCGNKAPVLTQGLTAATSQFHVSLNQESFHPVALTSGSESCRARATILPRFLRAAGSGRRNARSHSVSEVCHK